MLGNSPKLPKAAMPTMPPFKPPSNPMPVAANHPAVAQHIQDFNEMAHELDRMRTDNERLRNELEVERRANAELQHTVDGERAEKEKFQRYSVEMRTHALDVHHKTGLMLEAARDAAVNLEPPKKLEGPPISVDELEAGVAEIAAKFSPPKQDPPQ